jgi:hypothetical protein
VSLERAAGLHGTRSRFFFEFGRMISAREYESRTR